MQTIILIRRYLSPYHLLWVASKMKKQAEFDLISVHQQILFSYRALKKNFKTAMYYKEQQHKSSPEEAGEAVTKWNYLKELVFTCFLIGVMVNLCIFSWWMNTPLISRNEEEDLEDARLLQFFKASLLSLSLPLLIGILPV